MSFLSSRTATSPEGVGRPVRRREDARLVRGRGRFSDDVSLPGQAFACFVRSPHAHALIGRIDATAALRGPGVLTVLTGADALADGLQPIPHRPVPSNPNETPLRSRDGTPFFIAPHPPLPADAARFAGEAVAMVVAETRAAAEDAAERVLVEWEPLPAVTATADAARVGAPLVWKETTSNVCVDSIAGDAAAVDAAFARAAHVVALDTWVQRVTGVPMEPRAAVGAYDAATGRYTLHAGSGGSQRQRGDLASVLGVEESAVRVIAGDVGGNFGTRNSFYPEFALVAWAARRVGRPVKWTCERREALLTDYQGRDLVAHAALALDAGGNFLAFRTTNTSNLGAHAASFIPLAKGVAVLPSVYHIPAVSMRGRAVLSNTSPTYPYRSADSGDYAAAQDRTVALADWAGFEARRSEARRRGRCRGIGVANYIELNSGMPRERAEIAVRPDGRIAVVLGTLSAGQGHETVFPQLLAEWFDVGVDQVVMITGDTDRAPVGGGSHSGRSLRLGAVVMAKAADEIVAEGRRLAASLLEAAEADIEAKGRRFGVRGTDRFVDLFELAARGPLRGAAEETMSVPSFPYGCAVCE
ncbi:MAG: xanthine dehydrogenase family protein molybdopterin-binding subunit, partial [Candidatus Rokubacteria bacterium]|nr:xanthine dehydrogenase family protein molybdopterin-binding subunit [Candidatus Rokubacteria bacterium]